MPKIVCTLPNASDNISGVAFTAREDGAKVSEEISEELAAMFASIEGYALLEEEEASPPAPAPAKPAAASKSKRAPAPAPEAPTSPEAAPEPEAKPAEGESGAPAGDDESVF